MCPCRESRYFTTWKRPRQTVDFRLPLEIQELTGEPSSPASCVTPACGHHCLLDHQGVAAARNLGTPAWLCRSLALTADTYMPAQPLSPLLPIALLRPQPHCDPTLIVLCTRPLPHAVGRLPLPWRPADRCCC